MPSSEVRSDRRARIRASALWAAYGDALGFVGELASSPSQVRRRAGAFPVDATCTWRRRVGGRGGPTVELPAGCISDDTQLRLAVCRSIRGDGSFDGEVFSKIELSAWLGYALGAGRGSQVAAANLRRRDVSWSTNFFEADRASYVHGGGNGAAMRIQPHVWASGSGAFETLVREVVVDAVCTHGHMRGVLGALFHALCLQAALDDGKPPGPEEWLMIVRKLSAVVDTIERHEELGHLWLTMWRERSRRSLADEVADVSRELHADIERVTSGQASSAEADYQNALRSMGALRPEQRGSGTKTALLAALLSWRLGHEPERALRLAANSLGSDTDSIATMAGAILGAAAPQDIPGAVADRDYVVFEADRMWAIGAGLPAPTFRYPELRRWSAPRQHADVLGTNGEQFALAGLGPCATVGEVLATSGKQGLGWQWVDIWFGQRVLVKRRVRPPALSESQIVVPTDTYSPASLLDELERTEERRPPHVRDARGRADEAPPSDGKRSLHDLTNEAIAANFDERLVGRQVRAMLDEEDGIERAVAYVAIVGKALASRRDRDRRSGR